MQRATRLIAGIACTALAGCATTPRDRGPSYPWPYLDGTVPAPLVVRSATVESTTKGEYDPAQEALATGSSALLAGGRVGPLGVVIAIPLAFAGAFGAYTSDDYCAPRARSILGDVPKWVQSTFGSTPALTLVADAARRQLRGPGPAVLASTAGVSPEARAAEVMTIGTRQAVSTVILADVYVQFGEMVQGCKIKLRVPTFACNRSGSRR